MFETDERRAIAAAMDAAVPGASGFGAVEYVEQLLTALDHDPPRIWAAPGPWASGDGPAWLALGPWERHAWRLRLADWTAVYRRVGAGQAQPGDDAVVQAHACEATYGDPAYGGNRDEGGWQRIAFPRPLFPPARSTP